MYQNNQPIQALRECYALLVPSFLEQHHGEEELGSFLFLTGCICHSKNCMQNAQDFYRATLDVLSEEADHPLSFMAMFNLISAVASTDVEQARTLHRLLQKRVDHEGIPLCAFRKGMQDQHDKLFAL